MGKVGWLLGILIGLTLPACSQQQSQVPQPTVVVKETVEVPVTVVVKETVEVPVTVSPPTSAPTNVPTATSVTAASDQDKMNAALTVELHGLKILPKDVNLERFDDVAQFAFWYKNKGTVGIRAFTGVAVFADLFDRPQKRLNLTYDTEIAGSGEVTDNDKVYSLNPFIDADNWLGTTDYKNMHFMFQPMSILFSDGTKIGTAN